MLRQAGESHWRPPAGFCRLGENAAHTAVRVTREGAGLGIAPQRIVAVHATPKLNIRDASGKKFRHVGVVFQARVEEQAANLDNQGVTTASWMGKQAVLAHSPTPFSWLYEQVLAHLEHGYFIC
jgi:ADP-ribose pyrophosphatase YjhB (NUDIX family)